MDRRLGIGWPPGLPLNLNSAVDNLLMNEFDYYRSLQKPHPYIEELGLNAVPFQHEKLDKWWHNFSGVVYQHEALKLHLFGAVDDIWINLDTEEHFLFNKNDSLTILYGNVKERLIKSQNPVILTYTVIGIVSNMRVTH